MSQSVKHNLLAALRYLLKPLVRMALKNDLSFPDFGQALKEAYVDVAAIQMRASGVNPTEEGIFVIANIGTTEVRSILEAGNDPKYARKVQDWSPLPIVLGAWHTDPKYSGPYGVLRDLEFSSKDPGSFTDLAITYCPNISPHVLFDELLRIKAIEAVGEGVYRAVKRSYVPDPLSLESILNLARVVHNLCETLEFNLRAVVERGEGRMERSIYSVHGIPRAHYPAFKKYLSVRGQAFADDIDNWITTRDTEGTADGMQIGVGFYHYVVNEEDESALSKDLPN